MIGKEACHGLLKGIVEESPADQTEAVLLTEDSSLTRFAKTAVHQHVAEKNRTLILRVVIDKKIAVLATNLLTRSSLRDLIQKAVSIARIQHPKRPLFPYHPPIPYRRLTPFMEISNLSHRVER